VNTLEGSKAFKKIQKFSKTNNQDLFTDISDFNTRYTRLSDLYYSNRNLVDASTYGTIRQHNFTSNTSTQNQPLSFIDEKSVSKFMSYNNNLNNTTTSSDSHILNLLNYDKANFGITGSDNYLTDNKTLNNPVLFNLRNNTKAITALEDLVLDSEFSFDSSTQPFASNVANSNVNYAFQDLKSVNQSINTSDRSVRATEDSNLSKLNTNMDGDQSKLENLIYANEPTILGNKVMQSNNSASRK